MLQLIEWNNPLLYNSSKPFDFSNPEIDPRELENQMVSFVKEKNALGLSAVQVGINLHVFATIDRCYFNAKIIDTKKEIRMAPEGCLSFPKLELTIPRDTDIMITYQDNQGIWMEEVSSGLTARILQHEIDHCNGILFWMRLSKFNLQRQLEISEKKYHHGFSYSKLYGAMKNNAHF